MENSKDSLKACFENVNNIECVIFFSHLSTKTYVVSTRKNRFYSQIYLLFCERQYIEMVYSKTCFKQPLKNRQNKDLNDKW